MEVDLQSLQPMEFHGNFSSVEGRTFEPTIYVQLSFCNPWTDVLDLQEAKGANGCKWDMIESYLGVSLIGGTPKLMVYHGKSN